MLSLDGIEFTAFGDFPGSHLVNRGKTFDGYYGIQYNHSGKMVFSVDDGPEELTVPVSFSRHRTAHTTTTITRVFTGICG